MSVLAKLSGKTYKSNNKRNLFPYHLVITFFKKLSRKHALKEENRAKIQSFLLLWCAVLSHVRLFATSWSVVCQAPVSMGILQARILEWITYSLLQGIFPTQESNRGLLHRRQILKQPSYQKSPSSLL